MKSTILHLKEQLNLLQIPYTLYEKGIVINADCLDVVNKIDKQSIDIILTDPPYNINYADWDIFSKIDVLADSFQQILKPNSSFFCFAAWSFVCKIIPEFEKYFTLNDWIIYDRIKGRGAKKRLVSTREDLLWFVNGSTWIFNKEKAYSTIKKKTGGLGFKNGQVCRALSNVWTDISPIVPWSKERNIHPTQKPKQISNRILNVFALENQLMLDCYAGSGTFLESAIEQGLYFIGVEKDENFYNLINQRLSNYM